MKKCIFALEVILILLVVPAMALTGEPNVQKARHYIAQTHHLPLEYLTVANEATANYPLTQRRLWVGKVLDTQGGGIYQVFIDEEGEIADGEAIKEAEQAAHAARYGRLEPALYDTLDPLHNNVRGCCGVV